ncbi:MAG: hypothetical protein R3D67_03325 [Hyphomicrobiaceae bacterium]
MPGKRSAERNEHRSAFFENRDGTPCAEGRLCGHGKNIRTNSRLLLYLVTNCRTDGGWRQLDSFQSAIALSTLILSLLGAAVFRVPVAVLHAHHQGVGAADQQWRQRRVE